MIFWTSRGLQNYIARSLMDGSDIRYILVTQILNPGTITIDIPSEYQSNVLYIDKWLFFNPLSEVSNYIEGICSLMPVEILEKKKRC